MDEFVKLENLTDGDIQLYKPDNPQDVWQVGGVGFSFPPNTVFPARGTILLVNNNPESFRQRYNVNANIQIFQYSGSLQDNGENISVEMPDVSTKTDAVYIKIEEVRYNDKSPWPVAAAGLGASLHKIQKDAFGNDPGNWFAATPNPGCSNVVGTPPTIVSISQDKTVSEYQNVVISAQVTGSSPIYYQWKLNGTNIVGATNNLLVLTSVRVANSGKYTLIAYNNVGSAESTPVSLTVIKLPEIIQQPVDISVKPGTNVTFNVVALSTTLLRYQWKFNGIEIPGANSDSYTIYNVQLKDVGVYSVMVSDDNGSIESNPARLIVLIDPTIILPPLSISIPKGGSAVLSVEVTNTATLPITYRWRRSSTYLVTNVLMSCKSFLLITNIQTNGTYQVIVLNPSRPAGFASQTATITVLDDVDNDGMPDIWETTYGFDENSSNDAMLDSDGDGMNNLGEYIAGTDPLDPESCFKIQSIGSGTNLQLQFIAMSNHTYSVQFKNTLANGNWTNILDLVARKTNNIIILSNIVQGTSGYFRVITPAQPQY